MENKSNWLYQIKIISVKDIPMTSYTETDKIPVIQNSVNLACIELLKSGSEIIDITHAHSLPVVIKYRQPVKTD